MPPKCQVVSPPCTRRGTIKGAPSKSAQVQVVGRRRARPSGDEHPTPGRAAPRKRAAAVRGSSRSESPLASTSHADRRPAAKRKRQVSSSPAHSSDSDSSSRLEHGDRRDKTTAWLKQRLERLESRGRSPGSPHRHNRRRSDSSPDHCTREHRSRSSTASSGCRGRSPHSSSSNRYKSPEPRSSRHRGRKHRRSRKRGHKYRRESSTSSSSRGRSSSSDSEREGNIKGYWVTGPHAPGLPHWVWRRRNRKHRRDNGATAPCGEEGIDSRGRIRESNFKWTDQPPGIRLCKKIRERILNGKFVDLFPCYPLLHQLA
uniref:serine/arginine repetitive matrix protein 2-like n=1 Tax=Podarcis muralis TaxID=64176 RepID=UPI00109EFDA8|nr:serine/arginine repetitive matrix protein 2-like [Podarcis muralis]